MTTFILYFVLVLSCIDLILTLFQTKNSRRRIAGDDIIFKDIDFKLKVLKNYTDENFTVIDKGFKRLVETTENDKDFLIEEIRKLRSEHLAIMQTIDNRLTNYFQYKHYKE